MGAYKGERMEINKKVLLLAIYKKSEDESLTDVVLKLESGYLFSLKEGKKLLRELKDELYVQKGSLTLKGILKAKEIEEEFKL